MQYYYRRLMALSRVIKVDDTFKICYRDKVDMHNIIIYYYHEVIIIKIFWFKEINDVYGMFRTRCNLFERVYKHHSVVAVEHM